MPSTASYTYDMSKRLDPVYEADDAAEINVNLADGTYAQGTVLGELTATPGKFAAYATGAADGTQTAKAILRYACTVASGVITIATEQPGVTPSSVTAFYRGVFRCEQLTGLDAPGLEDLNGALILGTLTTGIVRIG
jgi:hypothetical protein